MKVIGIEITRRRLVVTGGAMLASAAAGGAAGYFVALKKLETKYAEISQREIEEAKVFYKMLNKEDEFATVESAAEALLPKDDDEPELVEGAVRALRNYQGGGKTIEEVRSKLSETPVESVTIVNNIFTNPPEDPDEKWDYETEVRNRTEDMPYVITDEEFYSNEKDYEQISLTYFEADDVLADAQDMPVEDTDNIVGDYNLKRFGHGSNDHNIVYVRNDRLEAEYEIARSGGSFAEEVHGFQHSDRPKIRKFRRGDDE